MDTTELDAHDLTGASWTKSSHSSIEGVECVEWASLGGDCAVRDSKNPAGPALMFPATQWAAFAAGVSSGEFD